MAQNIEGEKKLKVWPFGKIPNEIVNGTDSEKEEAYYQGLADGSIAITDGALKKLVDPNKVVK